MRIVAPLEEGDDLAAKRQAIMKPRVVREFLEKYEGSKLPRIDIGRNVLERMGVPAEATDRTLKLITANALALGLLRETDGERWVDLSGTQPPALLELEAEPDEDVDEEGAVAYGPAEAEPEAESVESPAEVSPTEALLKSRRESVRTRSPRSSSARPRWPR